MIGISFKEHTNFSQFADSGISSGLHIGSPNYDSSIGQIWSKFNYVYPIQRDPYTIPFGDKVQPVRAGIKANYDDDSL